ncbi:hypothetical protein PPL_09261 [Heterostelium album PN500]|uniref:NAD-dependent epimerase/dehydratase domain-containing protein n=1 Tax=Heterostelium pallidum (strain ATCC 26659 / Pp 5 / PN500) TaxID=670386 RepID=D3BL29_HETP5|nr:hypothetical protein PPL_09261 [Heterostelium album PN500]EFA77763.1 hypothetical protein PPL_09261 [Heterostelium album PN500]|eukprot:XP_020429891.1 hypothetical protein PPL_09261 [Heterostelium album PN500]
MIQIILKNEYSKRDFQYKKVRYFVLSNKSVNIFKTINLRFCKATNQFKQQFSQLSNPVKNQICEKVRRNRNKGSTLACSSKRSQTVPLVSSPDSAPTVSAISPDTVPTVPAVSSPDATSTLDECDIPKLLQQHRLGAFYNTKTGMKDWNPTDGRVVNASFQINLVTGAVYFSAKFQVSNMLASSISDDLNMKTAFVTGGTGFLGSHVVEQLIKKEYIVCVLYRSEEKANKLKKIISSSIGSLDLLKFVKGDVNDYQSLMEGIPDCDNLFVFHLASITLTKDRVAQTKVNVDGVSNLIEVSLKKQVKRFIYTSSISTFVNGAKYGSILSESSKQCGPHNAYGYARTKFLAEELVRDAGKRGLEYVILNPGYIIGRYDEDNMGRLTKPEFQNLLQTTGNGGATFVSGEECARVLIIAAENAISPEGSQYLLGGVYSTWKDVVIAFRRELNFPNPENVRVLPTLVLRAISNLYKIWNYFTGKEIIDEEIKMIIESFSVDDSKAVKELGFNNKIPIEWMIKDCVNWSKNETQKQQQQQQQQ